MIITKSLFQLFSSLWHKSSSIQQMEITLCGNYYNFSKVTLKTILLTVRGGVLYSHVTVVTVIWYPAVSPAHSGYIRPWQDPQMFRHICDSWIYKLKLSPSKMKIPPQWNWNFTVKLHNKDSTGVWGNIETIKINDQQSSTPSTTCRNVQCSYNSEKI